MKAFPLITLILLLCGCATPHRDSTQDINQFYLSWMKTFTEDQDTPHDKSALMQRYVAKELINRLTLIDNLYEQEIVASDYFMYVQDYAPEWIAKFHAGTASAFLGGEKVDVWLGDSDTRLIHLMVYTRRENGQWKIYRVRDLTHQFEHPIYDAGAIARARAWSAKIEQEYENKQ